MRRGCGVCVCVCGTLLMCGRSRKSGCESGAQLEHQEYKHFHYTLRPCTRSHANVFPFDPPSSTSKCAPRCTPVASPRSTWNLLHSPLARPLLNRRTEEAGGGTTPGAIPLSSVNVCAFRLPSPSASPPPPFTPTRDTQRSPGAQSHLEHLPAQTHGEAQAEEREREVECRQLRTSFLFLVVVTEGVRGRWEWGEGLAGK